MDDQNSYYTCYPVVPVPVIPVFYPVQQGQAAPVQPVQTSRDDAPTLLEVGCQFLLALAKTRLN